MPLRDHFRPPIWTRSSWEGFHGMWPAMIVQQLVRVLPEQYVAEPRVHLEADLEEQYAYEVLVFDLSRGRQLVAAIEIVSPANKDRPLNRRAFVRKCADLLQQHVCVSIVDLVTIRRFNLYCDVLERIGLSDPSFDPCVSTYAVTCRWHKNDRHSRLVAWAYPLVMGQDLPTLPIWLSDELSVSLNLEASYEQTCQILRLARTERA
jgi:hypothetical protein